MSCGILLQCGLDYVLYKYMQMFQITDESRCCLSEYVCSSP